MTQMTELADKEAETPLINLPHKLNKIGKKMNVMKKEWKISKRSKVNF